MSRSYNSGLNTDYIQVPSATALNGSIGTVVCWFKTSQASANIGLFARADSNSRNGYTLFIASSNDNIQTNGLNSSTFVFSPNGPATAVRDGKWHHVAYVYSQLNGGTGSVYVDGVQGTPVTASAAWGTNNQNVRFGRPVDTFWGAFGGLMAEEAMWNTQLSAREIAQLYAGVPTRLIQPASLVYYIPQWAYTGVDLGPNHFSVTTNGSSTSAAHPPIAGTLAAGLGGAVISTGSTGGSSYVNRTPDWGPGHLLTTMSGTTYQDAHPPVSPFTYSFVKPSAPFTGGTSITPGAGSLTLAEYAASLSFGVLFVPGAGSLAITGYAVSFGQNLVTGTGSLSLLGYTPSLNGAIVPGTGSLTLTSYAAAFGQNLAPASGTLTLTGYAPAPGSGLTPGAGHLTLTTYAGTTDSGLTPTQGHLTLTGYAAFFGQSLTPGAGSLHLTEYAPIVTGTNTFSPTFGQLIWTGDRPKLIYPPLVWDWSGAWTTPINQPIVQAYSYDPNVNQILVIFEDQTYAKLYGVQFRSYFTLQQSPDPQAYILFMLGMTVN